jgi:hypothetical protein
MGGRWTLRDIVDYELIATMGMLEAVADQRSALLRQIYEVNRTTVEDGAKSEPSAIIIPVASQFEPRAAVRLAEKLQMAGVEVSRAGAAFEADGKSYPAGTLVVPMNQVFARYAKDLLEKQTYPEVRRSPTSPPEPPYDVTAWSLGMLMGADVVFARSRCRSPPSSRSWRACRRSGRRHRNRHAVQVWLRSGRRSPSTGSEGRREGGVRTHGSRAVGGRHRRRAQAMETLATEPGLEVTADAPSPPRPGRPLVDRRRASALPATASMDEAGRGGARTVEFAPKTLHNADVKAGSSVNSTT